MPTYQYACQSCDFEFELRQSFTDESVASCPKCKNGARRVFCPVPIIFKGPGFYVTDNAKSGETQNNFKEDMSSTTNEKSIATEDKSTDKGTDKGGQEKADTTSTPSSSTE